MEIKILERKENPLLDREEVDFSVEYTESATPSRLAIKTKLAAMLNADADQTIIRRIDGHFGRQVSHGIAYVYPDVETAKRIESKHIIKRNTAGAESSE
jgi:small subunit ribosomal protein S24e